MCNVHSVDLPEACNTSLAMSFVVQLLPGNSSMVVSHFHVPESTAEMENLIRKNFKGLFNFFSHIVLFIVDDDTDVKVTHPLEGGVCGSAFEGNLLFKYNDCV